MFRAAALTALIAFAPSLQASEVPHGWAREWPATDFSRSAVEFGEIFSGGPPKDGIPSIDDPRFIPAREALAALDPVEPVMSVEINGDARAYPLRILIWHEIVNDTVGGLPIAVTFCPLCNSGVVFERVIDGKTTTFGTTGKLRNSDLVMYDRATESWWQQYEGRAIVGELLGHELARVPARLESIGLFVERHPDGQVQVPTDERMRAYGRNPYVGYDRSPAPFLYRGDYAGPGSPLMRVVAPAGLDEAWSLPLLRREGRVEAGDLVLEWTPGQASALDAGRIADGRDVGNVTVRRRGPDGALVDVAHDVPFAFAFGAFHPDGRIHHVE